MTHILPKIDAPIVAVTVYLDRARVTRRGTVTVPAGEHRLPVGPLPPELDPDSLRVSGRGPATVLGIDLVTRHQPRVTEEQVAQLEEQRRAVAAELAELADTEAVEEQRAAFLARLAERASGSYARALPGREATADDIAAFAGTFAAQLAASKARRRELARTTDEARDRMAALDRQLAAQAGKRLPDQLFAEVTLDVGADAEVELELSYVVRNAGWQPSYDLRVGEADGEPEQRLTLTWYALVNQRTGEDWPECELVLSTARSTGATKVPELSPWYLDRFVPSPPPAPVGLGGLPMPAAAPAAKPRMRFAAEADKPVEPLVEQSAALEQGVTAATYRPARPVAVPADGGTHRATVAVLDLTATLDYVTVPVRSADVHLRATVVNSSPHTLLPGVASVFHGGDFVARSTLRMWAPGEEIELNLGLDDRVRVERELVRRSATKATLSATRRREVEYRTTVANHTPRPVRVTVLDQLPVSRDEGIVVRETRLEPAPDERTQLGELTWRLMLSPGASREVLMGLRVELAKGVDMIGWRE